MKCFNEWLTESSLRQQLKVPQNPKHHSEGGVDRHTMMVRSALEPAIKILQEKQKNDPNGSLSNLDLSFTSEDVNILRLAGLLHDIGKGDTLDPVKLSAHGHEDPANFEKAMQRLGPTWYQMYNQANPADKDDLWWVIKYHMSLKDKEGFQNKSLKKEILDDQGKYKPDRKIKLLLVFLLMDRMGRGGESGIPWKKAKQFAQSNTSAAEKGFGGIDATASAYKQDLDKTASRASKPMPSDPVSFVSNMREKRKSNEIIRSALKGRFPNLTDQEIAQFLSESRVRFKTFMEATEREIKARLPLEKDVFTLAKVFKENGHQIYVIGGAPRDFLRHHFTEPDKPFDTNKTKDIDLTTDATPDQVENMLNRAGIKNFDKGKSFGVIVANINGEDYEIATFREDLGYSDGRRPDGVRWADMDTDYKRRDLTMNAIYYKIPTSPSEEGVFIDPSGGKGFEDIKNWRVRMIGDPFERIGEDKLRIARIPRFHSYYNNNDIRGVLDQSTLDAIEQFKDMRNHGVTGPRIQAEFWSGLKKSADTVSYLKNYESLGLLPTVFPGMELDIESVDRLGHEEIHNTKTNGFDHAVLVLALLLRKNGSPDKIRATLNKLEWPNEVSDGVAFVLKSWQAAKSPTPESMSRVAQEISKKPNRRDVLSRSRHITHDDVDIDHLHHLGQYEMPKYSGEEIQKELGLSKPGPEVGKEIARRTADHYSDSFFKWKNRPPMA